MLLPESYLQNEVKNVELRAHPQKQWQIVCNNVPWFIACLLLAWLIGVNGTLQRDLKKRVVRIIFGANRKQRRCFSRASRCRRFACIDFQCKECVKYGVQDTQGMEGVSKEGSRRITRQKYFAFGMKPINNRSIFSKKKHIYTSARNCVSSQESLCRI